MPIKLLSLKVLTRLLSNCQIFFEFIIKMKFTILFIILFMKLGINESLLHRKLKNYYY